LLNAASGRWRVFPKDPLAQFKDLRKGVEVNRNRDADWVRVMDKKSSDRRIGVWARLSDAGDRLTLSLTDEDGHAGTASAPLVGELANDPDSARASLVEHLGKLGATHFVAMDVAVAFSRPWFVAPSVLNPLRRKAVDALEQARATAYVRPQRAQPVVPPVAYPQDSLSYLGNVFNTKAHAFYARHGVAVIDAAFEANEDRGEVSLMITKHCVRFSLSLCPKQAKGVTGVQGQVRADPLQLINGREKLTLRFDCKACEMHVVGKIKTSVLNQLNKSADAQEQRKPMHFYRSTVQTFGH
jgi:putative protease